MSSRICIPRDPCFHSCLAFINFNGESGFPRSSSIIPERGILACGEDALVVDFYHWNLSRKCIYAMIKQEDVFDIMV